MLDPLTQLAILIPFALVGVAVGLAQTFAQRTCPCCHLDVARTAVICPHCRCRRPGRWG